MTLVHPAKFNNSLNRLCRIYTDSLQYELEPFIFIKDIRRLVSQYINGDHDQNQVINGRDQNQIIDGQNSNNTYITMLDTYTRTNISNETISMINMPLFHNAKNYLFKKITSQIYN